VKSTVWRQVDYFWAFMIFVLILCTATYAYVVIDSITIQRDVSRYNPKDFGVNGRAELQKKFDAYIWPHLYDLWIPLVSTIVLGLTEAAFKHLANDWAHKIQPKA